MGDFGDELAERFSLVLRKHPVCQSSTDRWRAWKDRQDRDVLLARPSIEIPREYLAELIARGQAPAAVLDDPQALNRFVVAAARRALGLE